jgi:microcystin-dependent protein
MSQPYLAELRIFSFGFPPKGWALANGQLLPINQNQALFSLLGTTYGGDGRVNFGLPNLQGRVPVHQGQDFTLGQRGGEEAHTLIQSEMPAHTHLPSGVAAAATVAALTTASQLAEPDAVISTTNTINVQAYGTGSPDRVMSPAGVSNVGGSQPHENRSPFLTLSVCIALQGIFPSRN